VSIHLNIHMIKGPPSIGQIGRTVRTDPTPTTSPFLAPELLTESARFPRPLGRLNSTYRFPFNVLARLRISVPRTEKRKGSIGGKDSPVSISRSSTRTLIHTFDRGVSEVRVLVFHAEEKLYFKSTSNLTGLSQNWTRILFLRLS